VLPQLDRPGVLVLVLVTAGAGAGVVMTLGADLFMAVVQPERAGEAAAIQETSFELGAGLGIAVLGTVLAATYRAGLPPMPGLVPATRPPHGSRSGRPRRSRAGSTRRPPVHCSRRREFDQGFATVTALAAVIIALTAVLAAVLARPRRPYQEPRGGARSEGPPKTFKEGR
jgi:DHA2 family multidrug resistance protein-like MFS transporter